jgi:hypothetical protein
MNNPTNNRERADRFRGNRSYIHSPGNVEWYRGFLALIALVLVVTAIFYFRFSSTARESGFHSSRGEVAFKHSSWNDRCDACHPAAEGEANDFWNISQRWTELSCEHCHAGPKHHTFPDNSADLKLDRTCRSCHHDHNGKNFSLVLISDNHCTQCHQNLKQHPPATGSSIYHETITNFQLSGSGSHPEFRLMKEPEKYNRTLKFSHGLHMTSGLTVDSHRDPKGEKRGAWTLADIPDKMQKFYEQFEVSNSEGKKVLQLQCSSCHELDSNLKEQRLFDPTFTEKWQGREGLITGTPRESLLPARSEGAYFLPINYEKHCQACHQLDINLKDTEYNLKPLTLPHRKQPLELRPILLGHYTDAVTNKQQKAFQAELPERLDPPQPLGSKTISSEVDRLMFKTEWLTTRGENLCSKCHYGSYPEGGKEPSNFFWTVTPAKIPTIFFEHAKFSHVGHRAMNCADCHPGKDVPMIEKDLLVEREPLALPKIDNCVQCHSPVRSEAGVRLGGVRHGCTDCHRYHNGDDPLQGLGGTPRNAYPEWNKRLDTLKFLEGKKPESPTTK